MPDLAYQFALDLRGHKIPLYMVVRENIYGSPLASKDQATVRSLRDAMHYRGGVAPMVCESLNELIYGHYRRKWGPTQACCHQILNLI